MTRTKSSYDPFTWRKWPDVRSGPFARPLASGPWQFRQPRAWKMESPSAIDAGVTALGVADAARFAVPPAGAGAGAGEPLDALLLHATKAAAARSTVTG